MRFEFTAEQAALSQELRAYFEDLVPSAERRKHLGRGESRSDRDRELLRQLGKDGWLGIGFPEEYGGQGRGLIDQFIFLDEARRAGVALSNVTLMTIAPALLRYGNDVQKSRYLQPILAGEITFCVGYSEPGAGTDLGSLTTRARLDGDDFVIDGHKTWTSGGDSADFVWLAARTDPDSKGYRGVSLLIVPRDAEGFRHTPIETMAAHKTTSTYYDGVRVASSTALVGELHRGWDVVKSQLNLERLMMVMPGPLEELVEDVAAWLRTAEGPDGQRLAARPGVEATLGRIWSRLRVLRLLVWRVVVNAENGEVRGGDASAVKIFGSELYVEVTRDLLELAGQAGYLRAGTEGAPLDGRLEEAYRSAAIKTFGGGVNEIQREIVAQDLLGLPRTPRRLPPEMLG